MNVRLGILWIGLAGLLTLLSASDWSRPVIAVEVDFERDVAPLLASRCLECHNGRDRKGGLDLTTRAGLAKGGESEEKIVDVPPQDNLLLKKIEAGEMPPPSRGQLQKLPEAERAVLRTWLTGGASWPDGRMLNVYEKTTATRGGRDWWSLQPICRAPLPVVDSASADAVENPIDAFVLARLQQARMSFAPPADKRTLIRRAYFDLLGLPPTPEAIEAFVADPAPDAWEQLLDQLLASPHYGERWGRHWLDVVRFAETCGYERDQLKPSIWRYRDWVVRVFNEDMPYDRFVAEQLAGDELPDRDEQTVIATGMLRAGTWNDEPNDPADYLYERLEDIVHTTSSAFLGLTVKCARCHDHKFDPIPQTDYYRFAGMFWAGYLGQENLGGPNKDQLGFDVFGWTDKGPASAPLHLLIKGERLQPGEVVPPGFLTAVPTLDRPLVPPAENSRTTGRRLQLAAWITDGKNPLPARVLANRLWLHHFGEGIVRSPNNFGFKSEPPTHPELLDWLAAELMNLDRRPEQVPRSSGSVSDTSATWTLKRLHKLIMTSQTYRQSSSHPQHAALAQRDFANRLLWRFPRRRLDAESLRDAMLSASGDLNPRLGGTSFYPEMSSEALEGLSRKDGAWGRSPLADRARRSIYMMTQRSRLLPLMTTFDFCDTTMSCGQRDVTTVPTQALALLNNQFIHEQSDALARRLSREAPGDVTRQIELAWRYALGRSPAADESAAALAHVQSQERHFREAAPPISSADEATRLAVASLCHVLLNTNEFIYVD